jgi:hypothetical protein
MGLVIGLSGQVEATGLKSTVYHCGKSYPSGGIYLQVELLETAPPGGPVHKSYQATISSGGAVVGLHHS